MGFKVYDPRLMSVLPSQTNLPRVRNVDSMVLLDSSFPPKNVKLSDPSVSNPRAPAFGFQPSAELARSDLWDDAVRQKVGKKKTRKVELDVRRARVSTFFPLGSYWLTFINRLLTFSNVMKLPAWYPRSTPSSDSPRRADPSSPDPTFNLDTLSLTLRSS